MTPGAENYTNACALLHGKWTRHQVSYRVPEIGQNVNGPGGTGNLVDPTGMGAAFVIARVNTAAPVNQTVWLDNLCISNIPGPLAFALGAINAPMISAGWSFEIPDGANSLAILGYPSYASTPELARDATINGNFSTNHSTAATAFPAGSPSAGFRAAQNASTGWMDKFESTIAGGAAAYIGSGGVGVALGFPAGFNQAAILDTVTNNGAAGLVTPFLDMALIDQALLPGLHVEPVDFGGGSGGGPTTLNEIVGNVSGIFGVRVFARADGANPAANPGLTVVLSNADVTNGIVAQIGPQMLPNGADTEVTGTVWLDSFVEGSFITFHSPQNASQITGSLSTDLNAENPGHQLAEVSFERGNYGGSMLSGLIFTGFANGWEDYMGEVTLPGSTAQQAAVPGSVGSANVFVDEVGLYTVRDASYMYDEDLCVTP
jgi:hypothetical protein